MLYLFLLSLCRKNIGAVSIICNNGVSFTWHTLSLEHFVPRNTNLGLNFLESLASFHKSMTNLDKRKRKEYISFVSTPFSFWVHCWYWLFWWKWSLKGEKRIKFCRVPKGELWRLDSPEIADGGDNSWTKDNVWSNKATKLKINKHCSQIY